MRFILIFLLAVSAARAATWDEKVVAAVILGEARGEGRNGMVAVGEVIRQRCFERHQSPFQVVTGRNEFTSKNGQSAKQMVRRYSKEKGWAVALYVADMVCNAPQRLPGITRAANHFDNVDARPSWIGKAELRAIVGRHAFYRVQ